MIPPDLVNSLRIQQPQTQAPNQQGTPPVSQLTSILANPKVGEHITATVQQLLPNGVYKATVGNREITLALPFAARPGDSLELEVVEHNGKMALALVSGKKDGDGKGGQQGQSFSTSFSQTGKMISEIFSQTQNQGTQQAGQSQFLQQGGFNPAVNQKMQGLLLNNNQALSGNKIPPDAAELAKNLQSAVSKSGMFYESHQAQWVQGKLSTQQLLQEPQAKFSKLLEHLNLNPNNNNANAAKNNANANANNLNQNINNSNNALPHSGIPRDMLPVVQQQLDSLANQQFIWQGQAWNGQQMQWEIDEDEHNDGNNAEQKISRWKTRIKMNMPFLGNLDAELRLTMARVSAVDNPQITPQHELTILCTVDNQQSEELLQKYDELLRLAMENAGLTLVRFHVVQKQYDELLYPPYPGEEE